MGWWQKHGNTAQWFGSVFSAVAIALTLYFHFVESNAKSSDDHTNWLIAEKLDSNTKAISESIDRKLEAINRRLDDLSEKVGETQGQLKRLKGSPKQVLGTIRDEIEKATRERKIIPAERVVAYKAAVREIQPSSAEFWPTVAAVVNYESFVHQVKGNAPDPGKVSEQCAGLTGGFHNIYVHLSLSNCVVDLDTQAFRDVMFTNSVIRYHGQPTKLTNVRFVNCSFVLDLPKAPLSAPGEKLLFALLNSPDQKNVRVD